MCFRVKIIRNSKFFRDVNIIRSESKIVLHQKDYIERLLVKFCTSEVQAKSTPKEGRLNILKIEIKAE